MHSKGNSNVISLDAETLKALHQSLIKFATKILNRTINEVSGACNTTELFTDFLKFAVEKNELPTDIWTVIFDNVEDAYPELLTCLQMLNETENTKIILTSRNRRMAKEDWQFIPLEEWNIADATKFVKKSLVIETDHENDSIIELCERLGNHALGMQQAVAYIIQQQRNSALGNSYSVRDYIQEFDTGGKSTTKLLLDHKLSEISHKFTKTTFVTWDLTIAKIKEKNGEVGQLASSILERIAYFDPHDIPLDFVEKCVKMSELSLEGCSKEIINGAMELLKAYSLVKIESRLISIHRLLQQVIRLKLNYSNSERSLLESCLQGFQKISALSRPELPHVLNVWKYSLSDDNLIKKFPNMAMIIFNRLLYFGLISEMYYFTTRNATRLEEVMGKDHRETLGMKANLAWSLREKGEWEKSFKLNIEVWEKQKDMFGDEDGWTLATANNMAVVLQNLKRLDEAQEMLEKVWESQRKTLGENHSTTMITKHNLALVFVEKGALDTAMKMHNELLECRQRELGERHPDTLTTKLNIGRNLYTRGKYSEAKQIFEDIWELSKEVIGEEHTLTLSCMYMLGLTHSKLLGGKERSVEILQQVLTMRKKVLGDNHPNTLITQNWINELIEKN